MARLCPKCKLPLVRCDAKGRVVRTGDFEVCPSALAEHEPSVFSMPWRPRVHQRVEIIQLAKAKKQEKQVLQKRTLSLFADPAVGKRPARGR